MAQSTYREDFPIRSWLLELTDEEWRNLPAFHRRLLAIKYGLTDRGKEFGFRIERLHSLSEIAAERGVSRQNMSADLDNALRHLMARRMLFWPKSRWGFPIELIQRVMKTQLQDRPWKS